VYFGQDFRMAGFFTLDTTGCFLVRISGFTEQGAGAQLGAFCIGLQDYRVYRIVKKIILSILKS
jgi:hypothetical protein